MTKRVPFTKESEREAVLLAETSGRTGKELAEDVGIGLSTLTRWISRNRDTTIDAPELIDANEDMAAELKRLRRENEILRQERDILKKATVFRQGGKSMKFRFIDKAKTEFPHIVFAIIARLMRENGMQARQKRRFKKTTDSHHAFPVAPSIIAQDFAATGPNQKWGVDISYIWTKEGWLYLAVVIDLFARRVVGWAVSDRLHRRLALQALEKP